MQENFTSPIDRRADYYRQRAREDVDADQADAFTGKLPPAQPLLTIPNSLTIFRIALVPFLVVAYLHSSPSAPLLAAATFCLAAITDWADGYLARRVRCCARNLTSLHCRHDCKCGERAKQACRHGLHVIGTSACSTIYKD